MICRRGLAVFLFVSGAALTACRPVPQGYYDWLEAGGGYYADAPLFEGAFIDANACRFRGAAPPRACRTESGRIGSSGFGALGQPLSSARMSGMTSSHPGRTGGGRTAAGPNAGGTNVGGHAAHAEGGGGGHGGHGGR